MATLNGSYQYIGRSNAVSSPAGWKYYILLYAKTSSDISTGKHSVTVLQRLVCDVASTFYGFRTSGSVTVAGASAFSWSGAAIPGVAWNTSSITAGDYTYPRWINLKEGTVVVNTGYGVAKNVTISSSWVMNESNSASWFPSTGTQAKISVSVTLPMIASASTITSASNVTLGNNCSVRWTPQAASFRYKLKFEMDSWNYTTEAIHPNKTSAYTYTGYAIPLDAARQIPNSFTGTMTVTLYTYSNSGATVQIGSANSKTFTVTVPTSEAPTVSMNLSPVHSLPDAFNGIFVQGLSKVKAELSAQARYGASIKYYNITIGGNIYGANESYTSGYITGSGSVSVVGQAIDSRDYGGYNTQSINVIPYAHPKIQNVTAERCDVNGAISDAGTYLKIKAQRSYSPVMVSGVQKNFCEIRYRYSDGVSYTPWVTILARDSLNSNKVTTAALLKGALSTQNSYTVQVRAIDDIGNYADTFIIIPTEKVYFHRDGARNALGLGKYNERDNAIDSAWDFYMNDHKITGLPTPTSNTDAVPKSYVDPADVKLEKSLTAPGWYKVGTIAGEMCAVVTLTVGGIFVNNQASPSMVDIATQHNQARAFLRLPSLADSQISKIGLIKEKTTVYGVYAYYNTSNANTVKINAHTHMGTFTLDNWVASSVTDSNMITVMTLKE